MLTKKKVKNCCSRHKNRPLPAYWCLVYRGSAALPRCARKAVSRRAVRSVRSRKPARLSSILEKITILRGRTGGFGQGVL